MTKTKSEPPEEILVDGMDSGSVSEATKRQLLSDGLGFCSAPGCNHRIDHRRTRLGECAHIIPRKVGSHPREDYRTSLDARRQESNLLYLCEKHHKLVDNKEHAPLYTAEVLRKWKKDHKKWASSIKKDSPFIPASIKKGVEALFSEFQESLAQQADLAAHILGTVLDTCRELIHRLF